MTEEEILKRIANKDQLSRREYLYVTEFARDCNFLVFGTGADTEYWKLVNPNTIFLENETEWMVEDPNVFQIEYTCNIMDADFLSADFLMGVYDRLKITLPDIVHKTKWDTIFVDAPRGYRDPANHGRMQSIFMASQLAHSETDIFIHDCNRHIEKTWANMIFKQNIKSIDRLRHGKI